jgi:hypothetical protein
VSRVPLDVGRVVIVRANGDIGRVTSLIRDVDRQPSLVRVHCDAKGELMLEAHELEVWPTREEEERYENGPRNGVLAVTDGVPGVSPDGTGDRHRQACRTRRRGAMKKSYSLTQLGQVAACFAIGLGVPPLIEQFWRVAPMIFDFIRRIAP